jgi:HEAT repeat protein
MRHRLSSAAGAWILFGALLCPLLAQETRTAAELMSALETSTVDKERWQAALDLGRATFADADERQRALDVLMRASRSPETGLRVNATTALGRLADPSATPVLAARLRDRIPLVRMAAARALGHVATEEAVLALLRGVEDANLAVRTQVIRAMGDAAHPTAAGALEKVLLAPASSENAPLRAEAASALQRIGSYALEPLLKGVASGHPDVRRASARALAGVADPRAVPQLIRLFGDPSPQVAGAAVAAIVRIGDAAIGPLLEAFDTADKDALGHVMTALGGIGPPAVAPLRNVYAGATARLAELMDERAEAELEEELRRRPPEPPAPETVEPEVVEPPPPPPLTDSEVRRETTQAKRDVKDLQKQAKKLDELIRLRRQADALQVQIDAVQKELTQPAGTIEASETIVGVSPLTSAPVRTEVPLTLPPPAQAQPVPTTIPIFRARPIPMIDRDVELYRRRAQSVILALGRIGTDEAVVALAEILQQGQGAPVVAPATTATGDGTSMLRAVEGADAILAAEALGRTANPTAVPVLAAVLADLLHSSAARANAARSLGRLRAQQAIPALQQSSTTDPSPNVRRAAEEALNELGAAPVPAANPVPPGSTQ